MNPTDAASSSQLEHRTSMPPRATPHFAGAHVLILTVLSVGIAAWVASNAIWLLDHRAGQPRNDDEWGYQALALNDYYALLRSGPAGWIEAVLAPSIQSPATTALTSLLFLLTGTDFIASYGVVLACGAGSIFLAYIYGRRLGGPGTGLFAATVLAATPGFIHLSRIFIFAVPATFVTTASLIALLRARGGRSLLWALAFGALLALMPLTRTMTVSFVPFLALVFIAQCLVGSEQRAVRARNLILAVIVSCAVAAIWLAGSATLVFKYLFDFGYGKQSAAYAHAGVSALRWITDLTDYLNGPFFVLLVVGLLLSLTTLYARGSGLLPAMRAAVVSPLFPGVALVIGGTIALASSPNVGLGFALPLIPAWCAIAAFGFKAVLQKRFSTRLLISAGGLTGVVSLLLTSPYYASIAPFSATTTVAIPEVGSVILTGNPNDDPAYGGSVGSLDDGTSYGQRWSKENQAIAQYLLKKHGAITAAFAFRNYFVNVNSVQVVLMHQLHYGSALAQIDPTIVGPSIRSYVHWLRKGDAKSSCTLLTSQGSRDEFAPIPNAHNLEMAAQKTGFKRVKSIEGPVGRTVWIWERSTPACTAQ